MSRRSVPSRLHSPATRRAAAGAGLTDWHLRLTAPAGSVVSHHTAAALWKVEIPLQPEDERVHLTVPPESRARNRRDRRLHRGRLAPADVTRRWSLPVTTPERTWRDLAGVLPPAALLAVSDQLLQVLCTPASLAGALTAHPGGRGAGRARRVLPVSHPDADSPMESVLRWLLHAAGLPRPVLQYRVRDAAGAVIGRPDLAWPARQVLVEFDGEVHRDRDVFVRDLRRRNRLVAAGWTVLRFTSADVLGEPDRVIAQVRAALEQ